MTATHGAGTTRRWFLLSAGAAGIAALGLGALRMRGNVRSWLRRFAHADQSPQRRVLAYFHYLKIPESVADQFVADYRHHIRDVGRLSGLGDEFFERFLLSTDFFQNGADESRAVGYVALYAPTITLCYNPLATFD